MNGLLKYNYPAAESTGVAHEGINEVIADNRANLLESKTKALKESYAREGTIGPKVDFEDTEAGRAILDMVIGSGSSTPLQLIRKGAGRIATNLMEPANYSILDKIRMLRQSIKKVDPILDMPFKGGLKETIKAVVKDKPLEYAIRTERDLPYRLMFDMKPRYSGAYKSIPRSYESGGGPFNVVRQVEFNPKTVAGKNMLDYVKKGIPSHPVMGGYKRTISKDKMIHYEDLWDLGMNKGEAKQLYELFKFRKKQFGKHLKPASTGGPIDEAGTYLMRKLAESLTNPVLIKGSVKP